ncbi:PaaI family thioesterase [Treponema brennaborense]|uniref:Phenylacetic acid degradation-related protein n=1 Tax=Treponema brennaborense (strain DSM 12168 / CIP 105900 / DD5/3) TaxID=906968 RepID=F4LJQ0_TREBD|nr:PaaI family thioesterase [Treponema brennaborense]AEE17430.1 phenylacetic acid degradation-related protein [Treponema brennaborense DSM 12168]
MNTREPQGLDLIREKFKADKYATQVTGISIDDARPGYAKCSLEITEKHLNAAGAVMGGVLFTLADFAFAVAANQEEGCITVSLASQIAFLGTAKTAFLSAETRCVKDGKSTCFYQITVQDSLGTLVAEICITGFKKQLAESKA